MFIGWFLFLLTLNAVNFTGFLRNCLLYSVSVNLCDSSFSLEWERREMYAKMKCSCCLFKNKTDSRHASETYVGNTPCFLLGHADIRGVFLLQYRHIESSAVVIVHQQGQQAGTEVTSTQDVDGECRMFRFSVGVQWSLLWPLEL